ncbi:hypothetical protein DMH01_24165 [Amycolatopsis sp. WAC 04182]|nr:hypothetical protein DMH01_24165 [Amycolatopsis sp. WAC 04182]
MTPEPFSLREEARRLLDTVPDERLPAGQPRRCFRTVGVFDGEHDLGRSCKASRYRPANGPLMAREGR